MKSFKAGDCVYFKSMQDTTAGKKATKVAFKGMGFGVYLGNVPPYGKEPDPLTLVKLMGTIGFLTFDDVAAFFGDEIGAKAVQMYEDKHYGKVVPGTESAAASIEPPKEEVEASGLLGPQGQPIADAMPENRNVVGLDGKPLEQ